ncbi:Spo0B domain-containing protein [Paenibacillus sp. S28]|uniref:Spo0B domain-containing protein n=1 Tax=Paenibacillus sp. S28 TaxID=2767463 RepID=UPI00190DE7FA|nr:Spo0B domain-containing protein [Paenibacillus sp. S28]MBJ9992153.1 Spo0B domain-containing protein [Paenibacillus sp. S28]
MKFGKSIMAAAVISIVIPLVFIYRGGSWIWYMILPLWILAVLFLGYAQIRRSTSRHHDAVVRSLEQTAIRTLNHHRHDWMNDLQILYGYIKLGKSDKAVQCVERIKEQMAVESKIAKLGIPSLIFYLQSFRSTSSNLELDVHVDDQMTLINNLSQEEGANLALAVIQTIRAYQYSSNSSRGESRKLFLSLYEEGSELIVRFEEEGSLGDPELLRQQIYNVVLGKKMKAEQIDPTQASFELRVPCGA